MQLAATRELARYWQKNYDWRRCEARLDVLPQFITAIDGLDIHFIHVATGAPGIDRHSHQYACHDPPDIAASLQSGGPPPAGLSTDELYAYEQLDFFYKHGLAYAQEMSNRPQTLPATRFSTTSLSTGSRTRRSHPPASIGRASWLSSPRKASSYPSP